MLPFYSDYNCWLYILVAYILYIQSKLFMSKELLQTQLDSIQKNITATFSVLRELIVKLNSFEEIILKLEEDGVKTEDIAALRQVKSELEGEVDSLIDSLGTLINEYQEFVQRSI